MKLHKSALVLVALFTFASAAQAIGSPLYSDTVVANGAVAYYRMSETSGTSMFDSIASNTGTYNNATFGAVGPAAPAFPAFGATNSAVQYDGTDVSFGAVPSVAGLTNPTDYSMELWFDYTGPSKLEYLLGRGSGASLSYDSVGINGGTLLLFNGLTAVTGPAVSQNTWHDLVLTRSGTNVNVYLDGALAISPVPPYASTIGASTRFVVASRPSDTGGINTPGTYDELSIYNYALSPAQVANHFNPAAIVPEPGSLVLLGLGAIGLCGAARIRRRRV